MAEETFYRDQILSNAAVLFPDTFRIVLRAKKADGRQNYEAVLVDSSSHRVLLAGGPGLHTIQEAYFNLLIATSNQMSDYLQRLSDKASAEKHHETSSGHHGTSGTTGSSASTAGTTGIDTSPGNMTTGNHGGSSGLVR